MQENMGIRMTTDKVKLLGRTCMVNDTLWFSHCGTGVEFHFRGRQCAFALCSDSLFKEEMHQARFAVYVNDRLVTDDVMDCGEKMVTVIDCEAGTDAVIRLVKLSESSDSTMGIREIFTDSEAVVTPTAKKNLAIEFVGDSITCGYGVDGTLQDTYSTHNENVTRAYAYQTAQTLDADYSMVSFSGHGIISGYTDNGEKRPDQLVPAYYEKLGNSYGTFGEDIAPRDVVWDFTKFRPDIVVINLGTNDASYAKDSQEKCREYAREYCRFLGTVREKNPQAAILCVLGLMGQELCEYVEEAATSFRTQTGDSKVYTLKLAVQAPENGVVVDYHPTYTSHRQAADAVAGFIREEILSGQSKH